MKATKHQLILAEISAIFNNRRASNPDKLFGSIVESLEQSNDAQAVRYRSLIAQRKEIESAVREQAVKREWTDEERRYYFGEECES